MSEKSIQKLYRDGVLVNFTSFNLGPVKQSGLRFGTEHRSSWGGKSVGIGDYQSEPRISFPPLEQNYLRRNCTKFVVGPNWLSSVVIS